MHRRSRRPIGAARAGPRAGSAARRLGRARAAGRARDADARRAARLRAARHVRGAVRGDRADRRALARRPPGSSRAAPAAASRARLPRRPRSRQQREVVDAFLAASRAGDFDALLAVLDPDVVLRADESAVAAGASKELRGAETCARNAIALARGARSAQPALVNGEVGLVVAPHGRLFRALSFTISGGKIARIEVVGDPQRLRELDLALLGE